MLIKLIFLVFICCLTIVFGSNSNYCAFNENCDECLQEKDCVWCIQPFANKSHCHQKVDTRKYCDPLMLISPETKFEILQNKEFSNDVENPTQLKPQHVKISLRKDIKYDLKFKFKQAANYPVDLYYLMDLSKSMEDYKDTLSRLGVKLAETMRNLTTNFRLGFGSFIDKRDLPFVSTVPNLLESPCKKKDKSPCASPYSYRNDLSLSHDYRDFEQKVKMAEVSGNLDAPEGGFDAIMQAIVCKKKIGWRDQARHLLVFSTDAQFHIAGDGKLAGVIEPNPARCYEDDSEYLIYDYPSVSHINYVANENNVNIIFAIVKKPEYGISKMYRQLSANIKNSNFGELDNKGNNVINLVIDNYKKIVQSIKFIHNSPNEVDIKFSSNCSSSISDRCNNVHVGQELEFTATIQIRECPQDGAKSKLITIKPEGINETLLIEIDFQCECSCSSKTHPSYIEKHSGCYNMGDLKCGVCDCYPGRFGRNCQCDSSINQSENITNCIAPDSKSKEICSGAGACKCGKCECSSSASNPLEKNTGIYCECDNFSCLREDGLLCSGKGTCNCGKCVCWQGYTGESCNCEESQTNCIAPGSNSVCSNHGKCQCGHCTCEMHDNNRYSGKYCEDCTSCPAQRCQELQHCVECQVFQSGKFEKNCETECTAFKTIIMQTLDTDYIEDLKRCRIPGNDSCSINFDYYYADEGKLIVRALDRKVCIEPPNILLWILTVIGSILLAGIILLLIWKAFTTVHDRREYAKFENERKKMKWGNNDNPLYRGATSTFSNPAYKRNSVRFS